MLPKAKHTQKKNHTGTHTIVQTHTHSLFIDRRKAEGGMEGARERRMEEREIARREWKRERKKEGHEEGDQRIDEEVEGKKKTDR